MNKTLSWADTDKVYYILKAKSMVPYAVLVTKDGWFWNAIAWFLYLVSFTTFKRKRFLEDFATTFGCFVGCSSTWRSIPTPLLAHEVLGHVRQFHFAGYFIPILGWFFGSKIRAICGIPLMGLGYILLFPFKLAFGRFFLEAHADYCSYVYMLTPSIPKDEGNWSCFDVKERALRFADTLSSGAYLWTLPNSWCRYFMYHIAEYASDHVSRSDNEQP